MNKLHVYGKKLSELLVFMMAILLAGCGSWDGDSKKTPVPPPGIDGLVSITVSPTNSNITRNLTRQFTAVGVFDDGTSEDVTTLVNWSSEATSVATITSAGLAKSLTAGSSTITAIFDGQTGSANLTVVDTATLESIVVSPLNSSIAAGQTKQFMATGKHSNTTSENITALVTWSSGSTNVAP